MDRTFWKRGFAMILLVLLLLASGCSSFNSDWRKASQVEWLASDLAGRWEGSWKSEANGHHGRLRCLVTKRKEGEYEARFRANYLKILSFSYVVSLEAKREGDVFKFEGSADLGAFGGIYRYEGRAGSTNFFSTYVSAHDHGTFEMSKRP